MQRFGACEESGVKRSSNHPFVLRCAPNHGIYLQGSSAFEHLRLGIEVMSLADRLLSTQGEAKLPAWRWFTGDLDCNSTDLGLG